MEMGSDGVVGRAGEEESWEFSRGRGEFCKMKGSGDGLHNSVNGSDTSELYAG